MNRRAIITMLSSIPALGLLGLVGKAEAKYVELKYPFTGMYVKPEWFEGRDEGGKMVWKDVTEQYKNVDPLTPLEKIEPLIPEWRPISEAPTNGLHILVKLRKRCCTKAEKEYHFINSDVWDCPPMHEIKKHVPVYMNKIGQWRLVDSALIIPEEWIEGWQHINSCVYVDGGAFCAIKSIVYNGRYST